MRLKYDSGVIGREAFAAAQADLGRMESQLARVQLDLQEIRASAKAPRDDLPAPLVDGRDYVRARLEQALVAAQKELSAAEVEAEEVKRRALVGAAPRLRVLEAQAELARQKAEMQRLAGELDLRRRFLARELKPGEVALEAQRLQIESELRAVQMQRELADARLEKVKEAAKAGAAERVELLRAQLDAAEQQAALERAKRALQALPKSEP
jgi:dTMP kinase